jgi:hypothetical protein
VWDEPWLDLPASFTILEDIVETFNLEEYFEIYEGDDFLFTVTGNEFISITFSEAQMTVSAPENWSGTETVVITLDDDPTRMTVSDTVLLTVEAVNDIPVLIGFVPVEQELEVAQDSLVTFRVEITDVDGDVEYNWFVNDVEQTAQEAEYAILFDETGDFEIECRAFDEVTEISVTWNVTVTEVKINDDEIMAASTLLGNYPNPFNPSTTIRLYLKSENLPADLSIFNLKGQIISEWHFQQEGFYEIFWNGIDQKEWLQPTGVYFYKLQGRNFLDSRKMLMIK